MSGVLLSIKSKLCYSGTPDFVTVADKNSDVVAVSVRSLFTVIATNVVTGQKAG